MAKAFISYKSNVKPDDQLASFFANYLETRQHEVFIQTKIQPGESWPEIVDKKLKDSDYLILLLSPESMASEMVIEEVRRSVRYREQNGRPRLLPVRLADRVELPYDVGARVNRLQHLKWLNNGDEDAIAGKIADVLTADAEVQEEVVQAGKAEALSADGAATAAGQKIDCPLPSFDVSWLKELNAQGGPVRLDSPFYVLRDQDTLCQQRIGEQGRTVLIRGSRQMGKTSLLARLYQHANDQEIRASYIDFRSYGQDQVKDLESLLHGVAYQLYDDLSPNNPPEDPVWSTKRSAAQNLTRYLQREIIGARAEPVVLFMEVDRLLRSDYRTEFFALVRSWHDKRALDQKFSWLNLVLSYSTEASTFITAQHQSPFNVGEVVELEDFTLPQLQKLNAKHGSPLKQQADVAAVMDLLAGHPFLTRQALYLLSAGQTDIADLLARAANDDGPFNGHLQSYLLSFYENKDFREPMKSVLDKGVCPDDLSFYNLRSFGLVRGPSRLNARPRCGLYRQYFGAHL
ncbi:MAG: AAA-like domain-containing protein [Vicinamibacterales bacterium]